MKPWDIEALSRRFEAAASSAERYMYECRDKLRLGRSAQYRVLHDEHLAKFYVYNYLHGRDFLESPKRFLSALKELLNYQETPPSNAFDGKTFLDWRQRYIRALIAQTEKDWPKLV